MSDASDRLKQTIEKEYQRAYADEHKVPYCVNDADKRVINRIVAAIVREFCLREHDYCDTDPDTFPYTCSHLPEFPHDPNTCVYCGQPRGKDENTNK